MNSFVQTQLEHGNTLQIEPFLKTISEDLPDVMEIRKYLADWYFKNGNKTQTIEQLDIIVHQLIRKGKFDAADIVLKTILNLKPDNVIKYQQLLQQLKEK